MPSFSIKPEDRIRLRHMLDAAIEIQQYVQSSTREDLDRDRKLLHSLVRLLEIIGEAANQVSDELQGQAPAIPWVVMVHMRNRLVHAYFAINLNIVWSTSTEDIPPLIAQLKRLLAED